MNQGFPFHFHSRMNLLQKIAKNTFGPVWNSIFPPVCFVCDQSMAEPFPVVCGDCSSKLQFITKEQTDNYLKRITKKYFDSLYIAFEFTEIFQQMIHLLKYQGVLNIAKIFADQLNPEFRATELTKYNLIIPVPLHPVKFRERGYNQSQELGKHLSNFLQVEFSNRVLKRIKNTQSQTRLNLAQRTDNVAGAFEVISEVSGLNIILVDDVITTGSTVNECSKILKNKGAGKIAVFAFATPPEYLD